jgi:hypothetical protein
MMRNRWGLLPLSLLFTSLLLAQGQRGSIGGVATDSSGAVLPGVSVTITNADTGSAFKTVTGDRGEYLVPQLLPGFYNIVAELSGFKKVEVTRAQLNIEQELSINLKLEVGTVNEVVTVEAEAALVNTESGSLGHVVQNRQIVDLPLNGRNVFDLVNLTPAAFKPPGNSLMSIAGGRAATASAMLDGVFNSRGGLGQEGIELQPPVDSMQEFKVQSNSMSAEFGRATGGVINATTKSGTNQFHGSVYEFLRNDILDSRGWNVDTKAPLRRNQFGGTIGGPIRQNKTFFFYNYDGQRQHRGVVRTRRVPTDAERRGDFSATTFEASAGVSGGVLPIYDPRTGAQFPGNVIPASRLDPVAVKMLAYLPLPNRTPNNPFTLAGNWQENSLSIDTHDYHTIRIDHDLSSKTKIFGRFILVTPDDAPDGATPGWGLADPDAINITNRRQHFVLSLSRTITPRLVATMTGGYTRVAIHRNSFAFGEDIPAKVGLLGVAGDAFPRINFSGGRVPMPSIGTAAAQNREAAFTNSNVGGSVTWSKGKHTLKFGAEYWKFNANDLNRNQASGIWGFAASTTQGRNASGAVIANSGLPLASFLLGLPDSVQIRWDAGIGRRSFYTAPYVHDDWKLHPRFTLNLGLRYELESPFWEVGNRGNNFDPYVTHPFAGKTVDGNFIPSGTKGVVTFPGRNGYGRSLLDWDKNNFAPRFGFAWRPFKGDRTVVRGGFGIFFGSPYNREVIQQLRLGFASIANFRSGAVPFTLSQGVPAGSLDTPLESDLVPEFGAIGTKYPQQQVQFLDPKRRTPYTQNFNLTIAQQWRNVGFEVGYIGNLGRKSPFPNINLNHIPAELLPQTSVAPRLRRPYPQFPGDTAQIQILSPNWGLSNYHGMTFKVERRFASGFGWIAHYTLSKWIDNELFVGTDNSTFGDVDQIQNIYDLRSERSLSQNDIRHRLVASPIYELPLGPGRRWLQGGPLGYALGGWGISTIMSLQSGSPFGVQVVNGPRDILGDAADGKNLRADLAGDPNLPSGQQGQAATGGIVGIQWFNTAAFTVPARFKHGNSARTVMAGPGRVNFDVAILKNFKLAERRTAQFRWEMFNATNTPHFGNPGSDLGGSGFGIATATGSDREMQFALKILF